METLVDLLLERADAGGPTGYHFLRDGDVVDAFSFVELAEGAASVADELVAAVAPGARVILVYPPGLEFVRAFFGALMAGVVAVPVAPPSGDLKSWTATFNRIVADAQPSSILTTGEFRTLKDQVGLELADADLPWLATDEWCSSSTGRGMRHLRGSDIAFIQYTSGSTSVPKGVALQHGHLLANQRAIREVFQFDPDSKLGSWLPMFHDMGLIGAVMQPLYSAVDAYFMSPLDFLQEPGRWLQAITKYEITVSGGPNFAYDLCVRRVSEEARAGLDLRSWRVAFNGAEVVRAATVDRFCDTFGPVGFDRRAFLPCYGLAEASLLVTGVGADADPTIIAAERPALESGEYIASSNASAEAVRLVSAGYSPGDFEAVIVGAGGARLSDGKVGELWVRGPSVAAGYWRNPDATADVFAAYLSDGSGPYLRTGDRGFLLRGELFITGRTKELLIVRGRNIFPHDIEEVVQRDDPCLRLGCGVAFAIDTPDGELPVIVQEVRDEANDLDAVLAGIRARVTTALGIPLAGIALVPARTIPKTTSGKLRRLACRETYLAGDLPVLSHWIGAPALEAVR